MFKFKFIGAGGDAVQVCLVISNSFYFVGCALIIN